MCANVSSEHWGLHLSQRTSNEGNNRDRSPYKIYWWVLYLFLLLLPVHSFISVSLLHRCKKQPHHTSMSLQWVWTGFSSDNRRKQPSAASSWLRCLAGVLAAWSPLAQLLLRLVRLTTGAAQASHPVSTQLRVQSEAVWLNAGTLGNQC